MATVDSPREFAVVQPNLALAWLWPGATLLFAAGAAAWAHQRHADALTTWFGIGPATVLLLVCMIVAASIHRRRVTVVDRTLKIAAGFSTANIPIDRFDLASAMTVDLDTHPELKPWMKTVATSLPGLKAGHFRLRDRRKAFVLVTDPRRVLVLPRSDGKPVLLSVEKPQALLSCLRELAAPAPRR